jgi:hypothetical protein
MKEAIVTINSKNGHNECVVSIGDIKIITLKSIKKAMSTAFYINYAQDSNFCMVKYNDNRF